MSRLIVLSNRVKMPDNNPMAGGLAVALNDVLIEGPSIWMGWNGEIVDSYNGCDANEFTVNKPADFAGAGLSNAHTKITYVTTPLTPKQYQHFYCGFANSVLWSLLHEQTDLISQASQDYIGYQAVNHLFAKQLKRIIEPDDVIWVHDYHFLSVAYYCRQLGIRNRIGFFLHIPFAPLAFWQQLDQSAELIEHLAHYDVLGTQTQQGKANCLAVFQHYLKDSFLQDSSAQVSCTKQSFTTSVKTDGTHFRLHLDLATPHCLAIDTYPIGVNAARIQQQAIDLSCQSANPNQKSNTIKSAAQQIIAVDRIDYSKGLLERLSAYRYFLQQYPRYQNQLQFLQIACPSRLDLPAYQRLYDTVKQTVVDINQQFSLTEYQTNTLPIHDFGIDNQINNHAENFANNWQAITYSEKVLNHNALMTAFWHSDIGWVNSLRDGMNLVAKEYVAAQNPDNPGVLLLSQYAGAAEQMHAAIIIDPHQPKSIIHGLKTALEMPLAQRKERHQELLHGLQQDNLHTWQQDFLDDLYDDKRHQMNSEHLDVFQIPEPQE